jgi:hypothetical protein
VAIRWKQEEEIRMCSPGIALVSFTLLDSLARAQSAEQA